MAAQRVRPPMLIETGHARRTAAMVTATDTATATATATTTATTGKLLDAQHTFQSAAVHNVGECTIRPTNTLGQAGPPMDGLWGSQFRAAGGPCTLS
jgi:hypothetical protein